jgi:hypothetical protein
MRLPHMAEQEFISKLVHEIEEVKLRVAEQTARIEQSVGDDDLFEDRATLRNLIMRLDGLKQLLAKSQAQSHGG